MLQRVAAEVADKPMAYPLWYLLTPVVNACQAAVQTFDSVVTEYIRYR